MDIPDEPGVVEPGAAWSEQTRPGGRRMVPGAFETQSKDPPGEEVEPTGIIALCGPDEGRFHPVLGPLVIGRAGGGAMPDVAVDDPMVSRRHVSVRPSHAGGLEIEDLGSRNGTFLEGRSVASVRAPIGSLLRLGDLLFAVERAPRRLPLPAYMAGRSAAFARAVDDADDASASGLPVLLCGETGTGKELFARYLHERSGRRGPLVAVNCAAIPPGLGEAAFFGHVRGAFTGAIAEARGHFAQAEGGTLFLDEVAELSPELQPKLLRVLETREYTPVGGARSLRADLGILAASNVDLESLVLEGGFRADLYARLAGATVALPALRERSSDLTVLARHLLDEIRPGVPWIFSVGFIEALALHAWPMNIRELQSALRLVVVKARGQHRLQARHVAAVLSRPPLHAHVSVNGRAEDPRAGTPSRKELVTMLAALSGNVSEVAKRIGKDRRQVYRWLDHHDLDPHDFK